MRQAMVANGHIFWEHLPSRTFRQIQCVRRQVHVLPNSNLHDDRSGEIAKQISFTRTRFYAPYSGKCNVIAYREEVQDLLRGRPSKKTGVSRGVGINSFECMELKEFVMHFLWCADGCWNLSNATPIYDL